MSRVVVIRLRPSHPQPRNRTLNQPPVCPCQSQIVRPNPERDIPLEALKAAWKNCSTPDDPACQLYSALFDEGDPLTFEFNEEFPFF